MCRKSGEDQQCSLRIRNNGIIYIYDILKKYQGSEILTILKNFGEVSSYAVKRLHKYQLIKVEIFLSREWLRTIKRRYITVSIKEEILNVRFIFAFTQKAELDELWKRTAMIKIPDYREKYNNIDMINKYLEERQMVIPISYGKNIIIQGELYFWVIFKTDERLKQVMKLLKDQVDNGWEILDSKKKKKKEAKNLLLTVPKNEEKQQKNKQPLEKSILRKEYKNQNTNSQKPKEEEVVRIIDQFCKGDLDANAREFILLTNLEYRLKALGPDEVVEIIEQDCRSKVKDGKEAKMETFTGTIGNEVPYKESSSQHAFFQQAIDDFNKINTKCEESLRKISEVKTE
jgi:hypothetical protein